MTGPCSHRVSSSSSTARPAAVASGFPDKRARPGTRARPGPARTGRPRRPPKAPTGRPPPITLPKHHRSGRTPDEAMAPPSPIRNPVMTSSNTSSAPAASHAARSPSRNPGAGGTRPMLAATGSTITQATRSSSSGTTLYGATTVSATAAARHAGRAGQPEGGHAAPAAGQQPVGVPVVAAGELDDPVPAGEAAGHPDRAHGRLGARRHQPHLLDSRGPGRRWPRPAGPRPRWGRRTSCPRPAASRTAATTAGWAWPEDGGAVGLDEVEERGALGVPHVGALAPGHEIGVPAHRPERAHRRVHAAGDDPPGPGEQRFGRRVDGRRASADGVGSATERLGELAGEVGQDEVGAGPLDGGRSVRGPRPVRRSSPARRPP